MKEKVFHRIEIEWEKKRKKPHTKFTTKFELNSIEAHKPKNFKCVIRNLRNNHPIECETQARKPDIECTRHDERRNRTIYEIFPLQFSLLFAFIASLQPLFFHRIQRKTKPKRRKKWIFVCNFCRAILINMDMELRAPNAYNMIVSQLDE